MSYEDLKVFEEIAKEQGSDIIQRIYSDQIQMDFRTTYKCITCKKYNTKPCCPPNIPGFDYFTRLLKGYRYGLIIGKHYNYSDDNGFKKLREKSGPRLQEILLTLEQHAFQRNYYWAISFIGGSCRGCNSCPADGKVCATPSRGRFSMEGIGIDVIKTCELLGIKIGPFPHPNESGTLHRIGLFLLE